MVALRCTENSTSSASARAICSVTNSRSASTSMRVASTTSPASTGTDSLSTVTVPSSATCSMRSVSSASITTDCSLWRKSPSAMVATLVRESGDPGAHRVRVVAGVLLDRLGRAAVGVALAQHRVDRAALDLVVAGADVALLVGPRLVGVGRQVVALALELGDRGLELRDRRADVRQLDDVGLGPLGQRAQLGQRVADPLVLGQPVGEGGDDAAGQRDVAGLDRDAGLGGVRLHDREEGVRRQQRRLVGVGVDDRGRGHSLAGHVRTLTGERPRGHARVGCRRRGRTGARHTEEGPEMADTAAASQPAPTTSAEVHRRGARHLRAGLLRRRHGHRAPAARSSPPASRSA